MDVAIVGEAGEASVVDRLQTLAVLYGVPHCWLPYVNFTVRQWVAVANVKPGRARGCKGSKARDILRPTSWQKSPWTQARLYRVFIAAVAFFQRCALASKKIGGIAPLMRPPRFAGPFRSGLGCHSDGNGAGNGDGDHARKTCAVCLRRLARGACAVEQRAPTSGMEWLQLGVMLPRCSHAFHLGCIWHWLERRQSPKTCPMCRDPCHDVLELLQEYACF